MLQIKGNLKINKDEKQKKKQEKQTNKWNRQVKRKLKKLVIKITRKYLINLKCQAEIKKILPKKLENL